MTLLVFVSRMTHIHVKIQLYVFAVVDYHPGIEVVGDEPYDVGKVPVIDVTRGGAIGLLVQLLLRCWAAFVLAKQWT